MADNQKHIRLLTTSGTPGFSFITEKDLKKREEEKRKHRETILKRFEKFEESEKNIIKITFREEEGCTRVNLEDENLFNDGANLKIIHMASTKWLFKDAKNAVLILINKLTQSLERLGKDLEDTK